MAHSCVIYGIYLWLCLDFLLYAALERPDMALFKFTERFLTINPLMFITREKCQDFTYVDDLVRGIRLLIDCVPKGGKEGISEHDSKSPVAPYRVVNIGNSDKIKLIDFIDAIEKELDIKAQKFLTMNGRCPCYVG